MFYAMINDILYEQVYNIPLILSLCNFRSKITAIFVYRYKDTSPAHPMGIKLSQKGI